MIRAVLDVNQFASALIRPGSNPARILDCLKDNMFQGDHHLLALGIWEGINIITAKEFLDLLF